MDIGTLMVLYLLFIAGVALIGLPVVLVVERVFGPNQERDGGIWTFIAIAAFGLVCWVSQ